MIKNQVKRPKLKEMQFKEKEKNYTFLFHPEAFNEFKASNLKIEKLLQKFLNIIPKDIDESNYFTTLVDQYEINFVATDQFLFEILTFEKIVFDELDENLTKCPKCGAMQDYSERYDTYFCPACNEWLEEKCGDENCEYCANRPENPLAII